METLPTITSALSLARRTRTRQFESRVAGLLERTGVGPTRFGRRRLRQRDVRELLRDARVRNCSTAGTLRRWPKRSAKSSASSKASSTPAGSTRRSTTRRRRTKKRTTVQPEANLQRRSGESSPGFSRLPASSASLVAPLDRWRGGKRNYIRHYQPQELIGREGGAGPRTLFDAAVAPAGAVMARPSPIPLLASQQFS